MVINMKKLERRHYLKHYLGGFAMALNEHQSKTGQIEQVDMEDGSVLIKCGTQSHWFDDGQVTPSLKSFADFVSNPDDIASVLNNLTFYGGERPETHVNINFFQNYDTYILFKSDPGSRFQADLLIYEKWSIYLNRGGRLACPDNIASIIFLLCELGYDVTGTFSK